MRANLGFSMCHGEEISFCLQRSLTCGERGSIFSVTLRSEDGSECSWILHTELKLRSFLRPWDLIVTSFFSFQVCVRPCDLGCRQSVPAGPGLAGQPCPGACECGGPGWWVEDLSCEAGWLGKEKPAGVRSCLSHGFLFYLVLFFSCVKEYDFNIVVSASTSLMSAWQSWLEP